MTNKRPSDHSTVTKPSSERCAVAAPEYFPGLQFAALLAFATKIVLADGVQYSRQSYHNRCRIRTPDGWVWLTVPIVGGQFGTALREIVVDESSAWRTKHRKTLEFNYRSSPFFDDYAADVFSVWDSSGRSLSEISVASIRVIARLLGADADIELAHVSSARSRVAVAVSGAAAQSWASVALTACRDRPVLLPSKPSPVSDAFLESAADVSLIESGAFGYVQNFDGFRPGMSTLDLLFNYGPEALGMIRSHCRIVTGSGGSATLGPSVRNPEH